MDTFSYDNSPVDDIEKFHNNKDLFDMYSVACAGVHRVHTLEITQWMWLLSCLYLALSRSRSIIVYLYDGSVLHHIFCASFRWFTLARSIFLSLFGARAPALADSVSPNATYNHMYTFYIQLFILTAFSHRSLFFVSISSAWNTYIPLRMRARVCVWVQGFSMCVCTCIWHCVVACHTLYA